MPNGTTHRLLTKITAISSLSLYFCFDPLVITGLEVGILTTLAINPDNDITTNRTGIFKWLGFDAYNHLISHRAGLKWLNWREFNWWKLFFFSHFPITGTFLRFLIVLYLPLILIMVVMPLQIWLFWLVLGFFMGMCLSDGVHILADIVWSGIKKMIPEAKKLEKPYIPYRRYNGR